MIVHPHGEINSGVEVADVSGRSVIVGEDDGEEGGCESVCDGFESSEASGRSGGEEGWRRCVVQLILARDRGWA